MKILIIITLFLGSVAHATQSPRDAQCELADQLGQQADIADQSQMESLANQLRDQATKINEAQTDPCWIND